MLRNSSKELQFLPVVRQRSRLWPEQLLPQQGAATVAWATA